MFWDFAKVYKFSGVHKLATMPCGISPQNLLSKTRSKATLTLEGVVSIAFLLTETTDVWHFFVNAG